MTFPFRADLFAPPSIERPAQIPTGTVFTYAGRFLKVIRVYGSDAAAPVIFEELQTFGQSTLAGQFALWSAAGVSRAIGSGLGFGYGRKPGSN